MSSTDVPGPAQVACRSEELEQATPSKGPMQDSVPVTNAHILVVDDDPSIRQMIADFLGDYDMPVTAVATGREMAQVLETEQVDLLILDLRLPGEDGLEIARRLREQSNLAIIIVTGRTEEADRVMALELGADDYITKPFSPRELLARVRALLRRSRAQAAASARQDGARVYRFEGWQVIVGLRRVLAPDGGLVNLSNGEFNLLLAFLRAPKRVLARGALLELTHMQDEVYDRAIDVQVGRLRRHLEKGGASSALIQTERGAGYVFTSDVEVES